VTGILSQRQEPDELYARNAQYVRPGVSNFQTKLGPLEEQMFNAWVSRGSIPFDPSPKADYDMRGFYRALMSGDPRAANAVNPNDGMMHYPDTWKTPYHETFSKESQWALPTGPSWNDQDQLISQGGRIIYDEKK
jgi:hypothetical protein